METYTRKEQFWAAMAGKGEAPEPITREEQLMKATAEKIAQGGGGGGGGAETEYKIINALNQTNIQPGEYGTCNSWLGSQHKIKRIVGWGWQRTEETRPGWIAPDFQVHVTYFFPQISEDGKYIENVGVGLYNGKKDQNVNGGFVFLVCECEK